MKLSSFTLIVLAVLIYSPLSTQAAESYSEAYPLLQVLNSEESSPGEVVLKANVIYPNSCFHPEESLSSTDKAENIIFLSHQVEVVRDPCAQALVENNPKFRFSKPDLGLYQLMDTTSHRFLGTLTVSKGEVSFTPPEQPENL